MGAGKGIFSVFGALWARLHGAGSNGPEQLLIRAELDRLRSAISASMPGNPAASGFKAYSQTDEDGILQDVLSRIPEGLRSRTAFEIGCGSGDENNTHLLALQGYRVVWVDGSADNARRIREELPALSGPAPRLKLIERFVDAGNAGPLALEAAGFLGTERPDLLSLDIDGNDLHVLPGLLEVLQPHVLCLEYNARLGPHARASVQYRPQARWNEDDYYGASLAAFCEALPGYVLVCCNLSGVNAFFVHHELAGAFAAYPREQLFQPARYELTRLASGHTASLRWLNDALSR